jgi:hypothetical protein
MRAVGTEEIAAAAVLAAAAAAALLACAAWWYRGLPHVQERKRLKARARTARDFRKRLPPKPPEK